MTKTRYLLVGLLHSFLVGWSVFLFSIHLYFIGTIFLIIQFGTLAILLNNNPWKNEKSNRP